MTAETMNGPPHPLTVTVKNREWHLFSVDFTTPDGKYSFYIYALAMDHALMIVEDIKQTATLSGQVLSVAPNF